MSIASLNKLAERPLFFEAALGAFEIEDHMSHSKLSNGKYAAAFLATSRFTEVDCEGTRGKPCTELADNDLTVGRESPGHEPQRLITIMCDYRTRIEHMSKTSTNKHGKNSRHVRTQFLTRLSDKTPSVSERQTSRGSEGCGCSD